MSPILKRGLCVILRVTVGAMLVVALFSDVANATLSVAYACFLMLAIQDLE